MCTSSKNSCGVKSSDRRVRTIGRDDDCDRVHLWILSWTFSSTMYMSKKKKSEKKHCHRYCYCTAGARQPVKLARRARRAPFPSLNLYNFITAHTLYRHQIPGIFTRVLPSNIHVLSLLIIPSWCWNLHQNVKQIQRRNYSIDVLSKIMMPIYHPFIGVTNSWKYKN